MRRDGFTLIEIVAVVVLLGLLAGAAGWLMLNDARQSSEIEARNRIVHADRMARLAARRLGSECVLRYDLERDRLRRYVPAQGEHGNADFKVQLPRGCRIDRIVLPQRFIGRKFVGANVVSGSVEIPYSTTGRSMSYAVRLATTGRVAEDARGREAGEQVWLVFSGLTGQMTIHHDEQEINNLFAMLARTDAD
jgi:prepilin-type N-terminal cleavage/methylation domain-containing protein